MSKTEDNIAWSNQKLQIRWRRIIVPLNFNAFLDKAKFKDDGSNNADWIRVLRIIHIVGQKNYDLNAPLGDRLIAGVDVDVMNVW